MDDPTIAMQLVQSIIIIHNTADQIIKGYNFKISKEQFQQGRKFCISANFVQFTLLSACLSAHLLLK